MATVARYAELLPLALLAAGIACLVGGVLGVRVWGFAWVHGHHRREPGRVVLMGRGKTGLAGAPVLAVRLGDALR
jgi:hypothetical protein